MIRYCLPPAGRPEDFIAYGASFVEAAYRCASGFTCLQSDKPILMYAPICANAAFACELFLKGLLLLDGKTIPKKHPLFELYEPLSDKFKFYLYGIYLRDDSIEENTKQAFEKQLKT